jgi:hypothetical protein
MLLPLELLGGDDVSRDDTENASADTMMLASVARNGSFVSTFLERGDSRGGVGGRGGIASIERRFAIGTPEKKGLLVGAECTIIEEWELNRRVGTLNPTRG